MTVAGDSLNTIPQAAHDIVSPKQTNFTLNGHLFVNPIQNIHAAANGLLGGVDMATTQNGDQPNPAPSDDSKVNGDVVVKQDQYQDYLPRNISWFEKGKIFRMMNEGDGNSDDQELLIIDDQQPHHRLALLVTQREDHHESGGHFQCKHLHLKSYMNFDERRAARKASHTAVLFLQPAFSGVKVPPNTWVELVHEHIIQAGARCKETAFLDSDSLKALRKNYLIAKGEEWGITPGDLTEDR